MNIKIETKRLILRPINSKDADFILALVNSKGWLQFIGDRNVLDKKDAENYIHKILDNEHFFYTVFEVKSSQKAIGILTLLKREEEQFPDFGFALLPQFEKKGYTYEASSSYLEILKKTDNYKHIIAITKPDNMKSIKLLKKLGFQYTADHKKGYEQLSYYRFVSGKK
ncbi:GNAT family N-acetyltransferase [Aquimarina brevivitae]|uniref:RimJ/RimL family protein N-acetyltransferase n=1 Tax=Aquimarina brevivitae TaxID=323412 RepID=A0A4Q7P5E5_9FLAO|nr:GNAT family N-acetyltransferase [Aquimarina brevivitae]RZS93942.1 RimJ/RimL family protein N-acetyltransferase [Aquimarina brevivitae]